MAQFFPAWPDYARGAITVNAHLIMTSRYSVAFPQSDVLRDFIGEGARQSLSYIPGSHWQYNNNSVNVQTGIVQQVTGMSLERYTQEIARLNKTIMAALCPDGVGFSVSDVSTKRSSNW